MISGAAVLAALIAGAHATGIWINTTPSLPRGLWIETPHPAVIRGAYALACLPAGPYASLAAARGYIGAGSCPSGLEPVLKPIVAVAGDHVTLSRSGVSVNGRDLANSISRAADRGGRPLTGIAVGSYEVAAGEVWLVSSYNPNSFDSRYFGAVRADSIFATAEPWLVFDR